MFLESIVGGLIGTTLGFLSSISLESAKRRWSKDDSRYRTYRLIRIFFEEVEQLAELLAIDLSQRALIETGLFFSDEEPNVAQSRQLIAIISRLRDNRTIFESQSEKLLDLPGYLPNRIVGFYCRLQINCELMSVAVTEGDLDRMVSLQGTSLVEAESLKIELLEYRQKYQTKERKQRLKRLFCNFKNKKKSKHRGL